MNIFQKILFMKFRTNKKYVEVNKDTETEINIEIKKYDDKEGLSALLDNCMKLVKKSDKLEINYGLDESFIYVRLLNKKDNDYIRIFKGFTGDTYCVTFDFGKGWYEYWSHKIGEQEKMKKLFDLCDAKAKESLRLQKKLERQQQEEREKQLRLQKELEKQQEQERAKKDLAALNKNIKQYM